MYNQSMCVIQFTHIMLKARSYTGSSGINWKQWVCVYFTPVVLSIQLLMSYASNTSNTCIFACIIANIIVNILCFLSFCLLFRNNLIANYILYSQSYRNNNKSIKVYDFVMVATQLGKKNKPQINFHSILQTKNLLLSLLKLLLSHAI